jgi:hypothetical protein
MISRSLVWCGIAAAFLLVALLLTVRITRFRRVVASNAPRGTLWKEDKARYEFAVFAEPGTQGAVSAMFQHALGDPTVAVEFHVPPGARQIRIAYLIRNGCHEVAKGPGRRVERSLPDTRVGHFALVDVSGVLPGHTVNCNVEPHALGETFVTTVSLFVNDADYPPEGLWGERLVPLAVALHVSNVSGSYELISASGLGEDMVVGPNQWSALRFRWERQAQRRDMYLVFIGALAAFGAAMLIEAARPFVDRIGARERPPA